ncbi:unnamed protein product [Musa textilis]
MLSCLKVHQLHHFVFPFSFVVAGLYLHAVTETKLVVDTSRGETLRINFDVTFPALSCSMLSLDAMDISGEEHLDVRHDIIKKRLDSHGNIIESRQDGIGSPKIEKPLQRHGGRLEHNETYCGSCYGAEVVWQLIAFCVLLLLCLSIIDCCFNYVSCSYSFCYVVFLLV